MFSKKKPWRSAKYLKFVRSLDCCHCGRPAEQAHHLIGIGKLGGMALKSPDWATMPLCGVCHSELHRTPTMWPYQWEAICLTLGKALDEGAIHL